MSTQAVIAQALGAGIIEPTMVDTGGPAYSVSYEDFVIYDSPGGRESGRLKRIEGEQAKYVIFNISGMVTGHLSAEPIVEIGYEVYALIYRAEEKGFLSIVDSGRTYWIRSMETLHENFYPTRWIDYLINNPNLGYYAKEPGLSMIELPSRDAKELTVIKGNLFEITPQGESSGAWARVKVKKYSAHPCLSPLPPDKFLEYELEGWIELVDANGNPNVWYYARGC